jgi:hypothetical protein
MNRRQALRTTITMAAAAALRSDLLARQAVRPRGAAPGNTLYVSPGGADANARVKDAPLRSLAEAARRVNAGARARAPRRSCSPRGFTLSAKRRCSNRRAARFLVRSG